MKKRYCSVLLVLLFALALSACGNSADEDQSVRPSIEEETRSVESSGGEDEDTLAEVPEDISEDGQKASTDEGIDNSRETGGEKMQEMTVEVSGQKFQASLYDNETVHAFLERLPMTLDMEELNGNEKFYYLDVGLPANSEIVGNIKAGDIMLFGSDCLVLFFEDFSTSYNYTRIGHIEEEEAFVKALSGGTVEITFEAEE